MLDTVHIILTTYNGERYLREQLDSVLGQTYTDLVVEICDDGSTDGTLDIISEYINKDSRVCMHHNEQNLGYVQNFLQGIKRVKDPYIMLCDQDDIWYPDKVEMTLGTMKKAEAGDLRAPVLVFTDAMNFDSETGEDIGSFHKSSHLDTKKVDTAHLFMENKCIGCTVMINHNIQRYLSELPDEIRVHDWWLALICSHFGTISYLPQMTLRYRQHESNQIGGRSFFDYFKARIASIGEQRQALLATYRQAEAFCKIFRDEMDHEQYDIAYRFSHMSRAGWFTRHYHLIRYGYTKSGWIRNIGLFLIS